MHCTLHTRVHTLGSTGLGASRANTQGSDIEQRGINLRAETDKWFHVFDRTWSNLDVFNQDQFNRDVSSFQKFLFEATEHTPGPVHPATVHFRQRRKRKDAVPGAQASKRSNPARSDKRARERRRAKFEYEKAQFEYHYNRSKVVRRVLDGESNSHCPISINELSTHFKQVFEGTNDETLDNYDQCNSPNEDICITIEEIKQTIARMKVDSSPGYDRVLMRTIKDLNIASVLHRVVSIMLATGSVPPSLCEGKTILIDKGGNTNEIANWRPITMYSILRRIIERLLDRHLRRQVELNSNQRGFVTGKPGCIINANLINACLIGAKRNQSDCTTIFVDITKAFDRVGHKHIQKCLEAHGVSANLTKLTMALLTNNQIRIDTGQAKSELIKIGKSVPQGGPMSPFLFNIAINHVFNEVCESEFANKHGVKVSPNHDALLLSGFADDTAISAKSSASALHTVELVSKLFNKIGLSVNPTKSTAIHIEQGRVVPTDLVLNNGDVIRSIDMDTIIRYLGCSFNNELVFDGTLMDKLTSNVNNLIKSVLLKPGQKLNVLNEFVFPRMTYQLQAAPLRKIPKSYLEAMDITIRNSAKAIIGLPTSTATAMIYAPRKYRGLGLVRCEWEACLQHHAIASKLSTVQDTLFHEVFDCQAEMQLCESQLGVQGPTTRHLRATLREKEFDNWARMPYQGIGITHFREYPKANRFVYEGNTLSGSEWTAALKLNTNYANLVGVPGVQSLGGQAQTLCRRCGKENETPSHVLGACPAGALLRNSRHHKIKNKIADLLRAKGFQCTIEAQCTDGDGRNRFVDILAVKPGSSTAFIIDPTIRWETNEDVGTMVQTEKNSIYESCFPDLKRKYPIIGNKRGEVIGLWFGARGTISTQVVAFFERFGLDRKLLPELAESVLVDSVHMLHNHIYAPK